ncbi:MAG: hypothetical protein WD396_05265 [Pseudohongiellaceae bacterium]
MILISNGIAALLVLAGLLVSGPLKVFVLNAGLFALSGGITNWLAVHMLFERVPGLYGSGVVQLRFAELKQGIRDLIMEQFFHTADLEAWFHEIGESSERVQDSLNRVVDELDLDQAFESLVEVIMASSFASMLNMMGGRGALDKLKEPFVERMREFIQSRLREPGFQRQLNEAMRAAMDEEAIRERLERLIDRRLDELTPPMVKDIMQRMIREHLGWLVVWGCAFGGLIGVAVTALGA